MESFPRTHYSGTTQRDSDKNDNTRNQSRRTQRSGHLHVDVQCAMTSIGPKGEENFEECFSNSLNVRDYAHRFPKGHWSFLGPGTEEKRHGTHTCKPEGKWNHCADVMMLNFVENATSSFLSNKCEQIIF